MTYTRLLKKGMTGEDVRAVKDKLVELGYLKASTHNTFGSDTRSAVKAFQKAKGLTVDGIVGTATWGALFGQAVAPAEPSDKAKRMCELAALYIGHPYVWGASAQPNQGGCGALHQIQGRPDQAGSDRDALL